ncbi:unnamed protein product [Oreochromis niloticus]|nr:unnamed protein product [Mustela putorius furo]
MYEQQKSKVMAELSQASSVALTTDGWTSRATENYVTVTAHYITAEWEIRSPVLQTCPLYKSHTAEGRRAIYSALTDKTLKKNVRDIITLSDEDVRVAEEVLQLLKPLKVVTTLLSTETAPSVSMILPLKTRIIQSMVPSEEDSTITRDVKTAIREDLKHRYTAPPALQDYLHRTTALDPRFKSLSHLDLALRLRTYSDLTTETVSSLGTADCEDGQAAPTGGDTSPPQKKSAMAELFGDTFVQKDMGSKAFADTIKEEVDGDPLTWWKKDLRKSFDDAVAQEIEQGI